MRIPAAQASYLTRFALAAALVVASLIAVGVQPSDAGTSVKVPGGSQGRVYDPSHLRAQRERRAPGRGMKPPKPPDPEVHEPVRAHAEIPNPEPQRRGGSGYARRGQYFYASPAPATLRRPGSKPQYANSIPNPEAPHPGARASLHSAATGGLRTTPGK